MMDFSGKTNIHRYRGFSSDAYESTGSVLLTNTDLVKKDIINHLLTRKGSRIKMRNFGTVVPDLVFEPLDIDLVSIVRSEVEYVVNYDPRVELLELVVTPDYEQHFLNISIQFLYIELNTTDSINFNIQFNQ